jgi:hypothetical protein
MRPTFYHKRGPAPPHKSGRKRSDPHTQILCARGWTAVDGAQPADHIINVTMGSHPLELSRTYARLCEALNEVMTRYYGGEFDR